MTQQRFEEIKQAIRDQMEDDVMKGELLEAAECSITQEARIAALEKAVKELQE